MWWLSPPTSLASRAQAAARAPWRVPTRMGEITVAPVPLAGLLRGATPPSLECRDSPGGRFLCRWGQE